MSPAPSPSTLLGGLLIEVCVALVLYGIITAQTYVYFLNSKKDPAVIKSTVGCVWIMETLHTIFITHMLYHYTIESFGNVAALGDIVWSIGASVLIEMIIVTFVQGFYIRRVFILSHRSIWLTALTSILLFVRVVFGTTTAIITYFLSDWTKFRGSKGPLVTLTTGLALSAAVDLVIAVILIYYLERGQTGFRNTDSIIRLLMAYAVNTGAVTMIVSVCIVLTFVLLKGSLIFLGFVTVASKLYANSFLGTLNTRKLFREKVALAVTHNDAAELSNLTHNSPMTPRNRPQQIRIFQETTKVTDVQFTPWPEMDRRSSALHFEMTTVEKIV